MGEAAIPGGYILLSRKIRDPNSSWRCFTAAQRIVFLEILMQAAHAPLYVKRNGEQIWLERGQVATSYGQLVKDIDCPEVTFKVVRGAMQKGEKLKIWAKDEAKARAKKGLLLTVLNYGFYQDPLNYQGQSAGQEVGQSRGTEVGNKQELKELEELKEDIYSVPRKEKPNKNLYYDFVYLSKEEYQKLIAYFGNESIVHEKIKALNNYIGSKGKKYKSHYHTILSWDRKDKKQNDDLEDIFHGRTVL